MDKVEKWEGGIHKQAVWALSRPFVWHLGFYFHAFTSICLVSILFIMSRLQKFPQIKCQSLKGKDCVYLVAVFNFTKYHAIPKAEI